MTCREVEPLLDARLDDELDIAGVVAVDQHLSECRVCARQYAALQRLHEEIAAAELAYTPSRGFERKLAAKLPSEPKSRRRIISFAAATVVAVLLVLYIPRTVTDDVSAEILDSHLRALKLGSTVDVPSSDQHTVKPWFQGKTSFSPPVPDLSNQGYILVGGRLEVIHQQPAAAIVYKRRQHVISLYVASADGANAEMGSSDVNGYHLLHWSKSGVNYWAVSDVNAAELREFAELIRDSSARP